jgi:hypothetical protein
MSTLDPVQIAALDFARNKRGAGFFLEQGLGKSLVVLSEFSWYSQLGEADRMIIVTPNTFKKGFLDEVEKHGFSFSTHIFQSSKKEKAGTFINTVHNRPPVFILNYEALRMQAVLKPMSIWAARGKTYFAIDESIQIKGPGSQQTKAVLKLASLCRWVRLLTGRPQTQGPHDLWGQLRAVGLFPETGFLAFRNTFCIMGGYAVNGVPKEVVGVRNEKVLAGIMAPVVFQAKKKDWLPELPRKDSTIRDYQMSTQQLAQYNQMERDFLLYLEHNVVTVEVAIAKFEKLAQIQTGFIYDEQGDVHALVAPRDNPRLNLLHQLLEEETEGKVCVVYRHRPILEMLTNALSEFSPAWIKGGMKPDEVEDQKRRFNTDPRCRVILLQAEASKYGHTLCLQPEEDKCRTMIFFENSYSADTRDQIEDRIHRRGQTGEAVLYIDLSGSDLDRRIVKALQKKDHLYRSVFKNLKVAEPA